MTDFWHNITSKVHEEGKKFKEVKTEATLQICKNNTVVKQSHLDSAGLDQGEMRKDYQHVRYIHFGFDLQICILYRICRDGLRPDCLNASPPGNKVSCASDVTRKGPKRQVPPDLFQLIIS